MLQKVLIEVETKHDFRRRVKSVSCKKEAAVTAYPFFTLQCFVNPVLPNKETSKVRALRKAELVVSTHDSEKNNCSRF